MEEMRTAGWYAQTSVIAVVLSLLVCLLLLQVGADRSGISASVLPRPKMTTISIYALYFWSMVCSTSCLLVHFNPKAFPDWYCPNLMYMCFIFKCSAEACLYLFYLQRAKLSQGCLRLFPKYLFRAVIPGWIALWMVITIIVVVLGFRGVEADTSKPYYTGCYFAKKVPWFISTMAVVDLMNSACFLFLFYYPWKVSIKMSDNDFKVVAKAEFRRIMFHHVALTAFTTLTTIVFLVLVASWGLMEHFTWMVANIDLLCQCGATFFMLATNRAFLKGLLPSCLFHDEADFNKAQLERNKSLRGGHGSMEMNVRASRERVGSITTGTITKAVSVSVPKMTSAPDDDAEIKYKQDPHEQV